MNLNPNDILPALYLLFNYLSHPPSLPLDLEIDYGRSQRYSRHILFENRLL